MRKLNEDISEHKILQSHYEEYPLQYFHWDEPEDPKETEHAHQFDELLFVYHSGGAHIIDGKSYEIKAHSIHFIPKGVPHVLKRNDDVKGFTLAYDRFFLETHLQVFVQSLWFYNSLDTYIYELRADQFLRIKELEIQIRKEVQEKENSFSKTLFLHHSSMLLLETSNAMIQSTNSQTKPNSRYTEIADRMLKELEFRLEHSQELSVESVSKELHVSPKYLYEVCKVIFQKSPSQVIHEYQIRYAKRLLIRNNHNLSQVAEILGFKELSSFSTFFKKHTGINPSIYQKNEI